MDYLPKRVVDAGYISWLYGYNRAGINAWNMAKFEFLKDLMVLDSNPRSFRVEYWPDYKANRRGPMKPEVKEQREMVRKFREALNKDWTMTTVLVDGLEADDIVAVLTLYAIAEEIHVIGVDKDYLQLPPYRLRMETLGGDVNTISNFRKHLPVTVRTRIKEPIDVLFTLALLGDRADNIPRLVKPYHLEDFNWVMDGEDVADRIWRANLKYGEDFQRNVYLAILPGPWVYDPVPSEADVMVHLCDGTYYKQELSRTIKAKVLGAYYSWYPMNEEIITLDGLQKETKKED